MVNVNVAKPQVRGANVLVSQAAPCQHTLRIHVNPEGVEPVREEVVRQFQREASLAGFRKGKAPRELVERRYLTEIREEMLRRLTRQLVEQAVHERKLKPIGPFEVTRLSFDEGTGLELEARVEVEPEFPLGDYRGIRLTRRAVTDSPEAIEQALRSLQESMAELVPAGEGQPKEKRLPSLDDEFAKDAGFESLEQLRAHVASTLRERHVAQQRQALEQALGEALLARHPFEVPQRLVERQTERLTRDCHVRLLLAGLTEEQVKEEVARYTEQLRTSAARGVKLAFILERIAEQEAVSVVQEEIVDRLWKLARRFGKDPAEVRRTLDAQGLWPSVLSTLRQEKVIAFLLSAAQIHDVTSDQ